MPELSMEGLTIGDLVFSRDEVKQAETDSDIRHRLAEAQRKELISLFSDETEKRNILSTLNDKEAYRIACNKKSPFYLFEIISKKELIQHETKDQRVVREFLESIFEDPFLTQMIDPFSSGMPDGLSCKFDDQGNLIIEKILEAKFSRSTANASIDQNQPGKTFETMKKIINFFNKIPTEGTVNIRELFPYITLKDRSVAKLEKIISEIRKIKEGKNKRIELSPDITYEVITPVRNGLKAERKSQGLVKNTKVRIFMSESIFSQEDLRKISGELVE